MRTVWDVPNNKKKEELLFGKHPTQKPIRLIDRIIKLSSKKGNILLSPFAGAGTDCVAAKNNKLNFIGFELEKKYFNIAIKRLK
jgi:site-specific DNA-methyltransferase (adenine-specific)